MQKQRGAHSCKHLSILFTTTQKVQFQIMGFGFSLASIKEWILTSAPLLVWLG
jgi:hypothetical protein